MLIITRLGPIVLECAKLLVYVTSLVPNAFLVSAAFHWKDL